MYNVTYRFLVNVLFKKLTRLPVYYEILYIKLRNSQIKKIYRARSQKRVITFHDLSRHATIPGPVH